MISQLHHDEQLFTEVEVASGEYFIVMNSWLSKYQNSTIIWHKMMILTHLKRLQSIRAQIPKTVQSLSSHKNSPSTLSTVSVYKNISLSWFAVHFFIHTSVISFVFFLCRMAKSLITCCKNLCLYPFFLCSLFLERMPAPIFLWLIWFSLLNYSHIFTSTFLLK